MDCINSYPNVFLRRWGGCLAIPQRCWGPLGRHNTTADMLALGLSKGRLAQ